MAGQGDLERAVGGEAAAISRGQPPGGVFLLL